MPVSVQTTKQVTPLRRAFALFGGLRLKLDETVVPVAIVEDLAPDEWRHAFVGDIRGAAGAANRNIWSLENPDASGKLLELYQVEFSCGGGQNYRFTITDTPYVPGTIIPGQWQDLAGIYGAGGGLYYLPGRLPSGQLRHVAAAAAITGVNVMSRHTQTNAPGLWEPRVILHPGQEIVFWQEILNTDGLITLQWKERPLEPSER